jgi:class 3 adenylate cyclase
MMTITFCIILSIIIAVLLWRWFVQHKQVMELRQKTDFAVSSESLVKIEFNVKNDLGAIAANFNTIGNRYKSKKDEVTQMGSLKEEHQALSGKVNLIESSISQITLITDIGKDITSSLGLTEILEKVFKYIYSSMVAEEVHLLIQKNDQKIYYVITSKSIQLIPNGEWTNHPDNVLNWSFANNKELVLQDAIHNYEQYVFSKIKLYDTREAASVVSFPFGFNTEQTGSIAVLCTKQNALDQYHLDFVKSLASYIAVAIDNSNLFEELDDEKKKSEKLLRNILPEEIATELKERGSIEPKQYHHVTVLFTDFVNFTGISSQMTATELVQEIHQNFTAFDAIMEKHGLEKIKTIGDAYMAVCGLPHERTNHAECAVRAALDIQAYMFKNGGKFQIRIGLNSGPVVAGVVGVKKYAYDIWGDTVNVASRMESNSEAGKVNISGSTYELIKSEFVCEHRGKIPAKNKGEIDMYFVTANPPI